MVTPQAILKGLQHWHNKEYFEAHQVWEDYWHTIRKNPEKQEEAAFVQNIITLAVGLVHKERGNPKWHHKFLERGLKGLTEHNNPYPELSTKKLQEEAQGI